MIEDWKTNFKTHPVHMITHVHDESLSEDIYRYKKI